MQFLTILQCCEDNQESIFFFFPTFPQQAIIRDMIPFISGLLLIFHFSLVFSITFFCIVIFYRTRDSQISRFLRILIPLSLFTLIYFLYYQASAETASLQANTREGLALYLLIATCIALAAFIQGVVAFLVSLIVPDAEKKRIPLIITNILIMLFLLFSIYSLILLNRESWETALAAALNELFLYSSILLLVPTIVASIFLPRYRGKESYRLLSSMLIAFYPMVLTLPADLILLQEFSFKLTLLTHTLLCGFFFFYILRHYLVNYEASPNSIQDAAAAYFSKHDISSREQEIVLKLIEGKTNREIGDELFISPNTVKTHIRNIYKKLDISNRVQLVHKIKIDQPPSRS
jgi:DNA-binding CsgD family transcriptional regulator